MTRIPADTLASVSDEYVGFGEARAFACVVRDSDNGRQLLVFDHPTSGTQIPKGRIDPGETSRAAAIRELAEESGLELEPGRFITKLRKQFTHPGTGEFVEEDWYLWVFTAPRRTPERWVHVPDEESLEFSYRWINLDDTAVSSIHPYFTGVVELIEQMFGDQKVNR